MTVTGQLQADIFFSDTPEKEYAAGVSREHVKRLGQFFTPFPVAHFMAKWVTGNPQCHTILDPAVGLGVFFRAILKEADVTSYQFTGYDIDLQVLEKAKSLFQGYEDSIRLLNCDYMFHDWSSKYDGVICNPPYQRFQNYRNRNKILAEVQSRLGLVLSGLTNLHTLFLLKSVNQLSENGRAACLLPSEFLNADYGVFIKRHLMTYRSLKYVIVLDFTESLFDKVITTSCILLFDNSADTGAVEFMTVRSLDDLACLERQFPHYPNIRTSGRAVSYKDLDEHIKWRAYYQKPNRSRYKNLVPLAAYGKIVRGIATGDNDYFTFNEQKKREFEIEDKYLLPCLTKAQQAGSCFFTKEDFEKSRVAGRNVYLLNVTDVTSPAVRRYIQLGEQLGVHKKYLTSHRRPWYAIERRPPAPILVTVFNRNGLRFVRNEAAVRNLTCFHCFYPNPFASDKMDMLMAWLLTDIARELFNDNRREYGQGLEKFEPNDLNNAEVIDWQAVGPESAREIAEVLACYRASVLQDRPDTAALEVLNRIYSGLILK